MDHDEIKGFLFGGALMWLGLGFVTGGIVTAEERDKGGTGCVYKSIASVVSPGYIIGCELFRKRWNLGK